MGCPKLLEPPRSWLHMWKNQLSGRIPCAVSSLTQMTVVWLRINKLSGPIPDGISCSMALRHLFMGLNQLRGSIPGELLRHPSLGNQGQPKDWDSGGLLQSRETGKSRKETGEGAGKSAAKIRGAGGSAGEGAAPHSCPRKAPPRSTLASTPASTPSFRSTLPSTLPSFFSGFPVSLFCSRPSGSQPKENYCNGQIVGHAAHATETESWQSIYGRNESRSLKDGPGLPKVPQNSVEPLGFCTGVLQSVSRSKKPVEERFPRNPKVLQNIGCQAKLFRPCKFLFRSGIWRFALDPFFVINPGVLGSWIDRSWRLLPWGPKAH